MRHNLTKQKLQTYSDSYFNYLVAFITCVPVIM